MEFFRIRNRLKLIVCDLHTAWQVFVQSIVAPLTSPLLPFHPKVFLFGLFLLRSCRSLTFFVFCCIIFVLCLHVFFHRFASLASPLLPSHLKLLSLRALPFVHLMLFVCCFVLCPCPSLFVMSFFAKHGETEIASSSLSAIDALCIFRSLFCFLRPLALLSCVVSFFGEKPKQKGSPKPRLASQLKAIRFENLTKYTF